MPKKAPRNTPDRVLQTALALFNAHGEPNITTNAIADELGISPGNLYYHFRSKDDIVNRLFALYHAEIGPLLTPPESHEPELEDLWLFLHLLFELIWKYRFLYRDLNDLLMRNRTLETQFKHVLQQKSAVALRLQQGLKKRGSYRASPDEMQAVAHNMALIATYWLSFAHVRDPRHLNEPGVLSRALGQGAYQVMALLAPYLAGDEQRLFNRLADAYR